MKSISVRTLFSCVFFFVLYTAHAQVTATGTIMGGKALTGEIHVFNSDSTVLFGYESTGQKTENGVSYSVRRYDMSTLKTISEKTIVLPGHILFSYEEKGTTWFVGHTATKGKNKVFRVRHSETENAVGPDFFGDIPDPYFYLSYHFYSEEKKLHYCVYTSDVSLKGKTSVMLVTFDEALQETDKQEINFPEFPKGVFLFDCAMDQHGWLSLLLAPADKLKEHASRAGGASELIVWTYKERGSNATVIMPLEGGETLASPMLLFGFSGQPFITGLNKTDDVNEIIVISLSKELDNKTEQHNIPVTLPKGRFEYDFISQVTLNADSSLCYVTASSFGKATSITCIAKNFRCRWAHALPQMPATNFAAVPAILCVLEIVPGTDSVSLVYYHYRTQTENTEWIDNAAQLHDVKDKTFAYSAVSMLNISLQNGNGHLHYNLTPNGHKACAGICEIVYSDNSTILARAVLSENKVLSTQLFSLKR